MNARLICRAKRVLCPCIAVAVGIAVFQVEGPVPLRRVLTQVVAGSRTRRDRNSCLAVVVQSVAPHIVARGREQQKAPCSVVAGVVVIEGVVIAPVEREAVLIVEGGGVVAEKVAGGGATLIAARAEAAVDYEAEEVPRRRHTLHKRIGHLLKVHGLDESGDGSRPEDLHAGAPGRQAHARGNAHMYQPEICRVLGDGMAAEQEDDIVGLDVNAVSIEADEVVAEKVGSGLRDDGGTLRDDNSVIRQVICQESVKGPCAITIKESNLPAWV